MLYSVMFKFDPIAILLLLGLVAVLLAIAALERWLKKP